MRRRDFLTLVAGSVLLSPWDLRAEHHVISADPWIVAFDLESLRGRDTSNEDFYVRNHFDVPRISASAILRVEGEVEKAQQLSLANLSELRRQQTATVLECAGDAVASVLLASDGVWDGWLLRDILDLARPTPKAAFLHLFGRDGYARSVPIERAMNGGMLATSLNQNSLGPNHGAPWRALFPGWYGMDSVKWLERIVVSASPLAENGNAYIELLKQPSGGLIRRPLPRVQVKSVITSPSDGGVLQQGAITIRGVAWSGEGRIAKVEVTDSMTKQWRPATLHPGGPYEWTLWESPLRLAMAGAVELACRATDEKGNTQPSHRDPARLDHYVNNWYHRVQCVVT
jgi:DMSO/TMAO reductase YedYZ molybdopterin-dependent catalytic subunit